MLDIRIKNFNNYTDIDELAKLTYKAKRESGSLGKEQTIEAFKIELEKTRDSYKLVLFYGYEKSQLVGFLLLSINFPKFAMIWDWQPVVLPQYDEDSIAAQLIRRCIDYVKKGDFERLEVCFCIENKLDKRLFQKYVKWYKALDFDEVMEEATLKLLLNDMKNEKIIFPENIEIKTLKDVPSNELKKCSREAFDNSEDKMYLDLNESEKNTVIDEWFNISKPIIEDASIVLKENNRIIGFLVSRPKPDEVQIGPFGITQSYRNKGLGKALLISSLNILKEKGFKTITLDVGLENKAAYKLHSKVGFKKIFQTRIYALKLI